MEPELLKNAGETLGYFREGGMAGVAAVLLIILFWLIRQLITLQKETNAIISSHNEISKQIFDLQARMICTLDNVHLKLITRPCIRKEE